MNSGYKIYSKSILFAHILTTYMRTYIYCLEAHIYVIYPIIIYILCIDLLEQDHLVDINI